MGLDVWPTRAQFAPGEQIGLQVVARDLPPHPVAVRCRVLRGAGTAGAADLVLDDTWHRVEVGADGTVDQTLLLRPPPCDPDQACGFAAELTADLDGGTPVRATTSFDVSPHWNRAPRYGFFADFAPQESEDESRRRADLMLRLHINVVQFYDWMYSHHTLVPPTPEFVDPLGRRLSRTVAERKIALAHERGMAAMGYGALYGAEADFSESHPDWLLYDGRRRPHVLADIFYLQDIRPVSGWRSWILDQFRDALEVMGFDGIHIDQYGYPKRSLSRASGDWQEVRLAEEFAPFVEEACSRTLDVRPAGGSIFNLVNAWPLDTMGAVTSDAATYIEVWEPHSTYRDLYDLIVRARELRPDKQVILAAYLRPFHPVDGRSPGAMTTFRLASATIAAAGGFHLIAGEGNGLLTEAYYPTYGVLEDEEWQVVRRYLDFVVRHTAALHAATPDVAWVQVGPTNDVILLDHPDLPAPRPDGPTTGHQVSYCAGAVPGTVWVVAREDGPVTVLNLVNLVGIDSARWNVDQVQAPRPFTDIVVRVAVTGDVSGVWWDTPDDDTGVPRPLDFTVIEDERNRYLVFTLPRLELWSLVWWRLG